jgi:hypothetical protein
MNNALQMLSKYMYFGYFIYLYKIKSDSLKGKIVIIIVIPLITTVYKIENERFVLF